MLVPLRKHGKINKTNFAVLRGISLDAPTAHYCVQLRGQDFELP